MRGELVELPARLVDATALGEQQREHAAPAAHERHGVGVLAQVRLAVEVAPADALLEEALAIRDELRHRALQLVGARDRLGREPLGRVELAAHVRQERAVQRVEDERARLAEPARGLAVGLDLGLGASRVVELEQQVDPPQPHLHGELGVVRALAQLERLGGDRQAALGGVRAPHRREPLGEHERERAVGEHALRRRAVRELRGEDPARERERLVDELLAAIDLRGPEQRARELHAGAAAQGVDAHAVGGVAGVGGVQVLERLLEPGRELGVDDAAGVAGHHAGERRLGEVAGVLEPAGVLGRRSQRGARALEIADRG